MPGVKGKRRVTGFILFYMCLRRNYKKCPITAVASYAGDLWRRMNPCQKQRYIEAALQMNQKENDKIGNKKEDSIVMRPPRPRRKGKMKKRTRKSDLLLQPPAPRQMYRERKQKKKRGRKLRFCRNKDGLEGDSGSVVKRRNSKTNCNQNNIKLLSTSNFTLGPTIPLNSSTTGISKPPGAVKHVRPRGSAKHALPRGSLHHVRPRGSLRPVRPRRNPVRRVNTRRNPARRCATRGEWTCGESQMEELPWELYKWSHRLRRDFSRRDMPRANRRRQNVPSLKRDRGREK